MADDNIQHGIDDDPHNDAEKGATLGGLGGAVVGAAAGAAAGPVGAVVGAVVGGLAGAGASGVAVAAVDTVDNDNTVSGIGDGATHDIANPATSGTLQSSDITGNPLIDSYDTGTASANAVYPSTGANTGVTNADVSDLNIDRGIGNDVPNVRSDAGVLGNAGSIGNDLPGVQTGGVTTAGADTRGVTEKAADAATGDRIDDKTGARVI